MNDITYTGLPLRFVCMSERDIDEAKQQINNIANSLAKTNQVYWRKPIEIWKDHQFDTDIVYTYVTARLVFAPQAPYGLFARPVTFDNDNLVTGFGLVDHSSSK